MDDDITAEWEQYNVAAQISETPEKNVHRIS